MVDLVWEKKQFEKWNKLAKITGETPEFSTAIIWNAQWEAWLARAEKCEKLHGKYRMGKEAV